MGSSRSASFEASPSKYVPSSVRIRPIALSRFVSSNSSLDERAKRALVAEEPLERPRQAPVAVREVRPERLVQRLRGPDVDLLGLADELLELRPDDVDVDRHARVLEREQSDLQRPLDEGRPILDRPLREEGGESRVPDDEALDDDPVAFDADLGGRELDDSCFHGRDRQGCL